VTEAHSDSIEFICAIQKTCVYVCMYGWGQCFKLPSVVWHCWLCHWKSIWNVKKVFVAHDQRFSSETSEQRKSNGLTQNSH